jgi:1,4-dihydroxy-2-naphthoate octaprenyltransferase
MDDRRGISFIVGTLVTMLAFWWLKGQVTWTVIGIAFTVGLLSSLTLGEVIGFVFIGFGCIGVFVFLTGTVPEWVLKLLA